MEMKSEFKNRLIMVHGWAGTPTGGWFPWLASEMGQRGWKVLVPAMPNTNNPKQAEWVPFLKQIVGKVDKNTFMVGHSLGCVTILRFLESLPSEEQIGGVVLVAGVDNPLKFKELRNIFQEPLNWQQLKK